MSSQLSSSTRFFQVPNRPVIYQWNGEQTVMWTVHGGGRAYGYTSEKVQALLDSGQWIEAWPAHSVFTKWLHG